MKKSSQFLCPRPGYFPETSAFSPGGATFSRIYTVDLLAELKDFFAVRVCEVPSFGLRVKVFDQAIGRSKRLLDVSIVVEDTCRLSVRTDFFAVPVRIANLLY